MTILFEGKEYATQEELRKDRFPSRSCHIIKRYIIQGGCKTMAEVAMAEAVAYQDGLKKALIASRKGRPKPGGPKAG